MSLEINMDPCKPLVKEGFGKGEAQAQSSWNMKCAAKVLCSLDTVTNVDLKHIRYPKPEVTPVRRKTKGLDQLGHLRIVVVCSKDGSQCPSHMLYHVLCCGGFLTEGMFCSGNMQERHVIKLSYSLSEFKGRDRLELKKQPCLESPQTSVLHEKQLSRDNVHQQAVH